MWYVLYHNVNALTERTSLDICGDETYYLFSGFYEIGSDIYGQVNNITGVIKGVQTTFVTD